MTDHEIEHLDVRHLGVPGVIWCWRVDDVLIDPGPESSMGELLDELPGDVEPRAILLTHIHFDHAGATGALVREFPDVEVYVHEQGARHLIDPERLVASATRLYGDDFDRLWGEVVPVPERNVRLIEGDGETVLGAFEVQYTPGHARHHVCYLHRDTATAFVGDMAGIVIDGGPTVAPTPPPDIDLEAWRAALATIAAWSPERLAITHGAMIDDPFLQLAQVAAWLDRHAEAARALELPDYVEFMRAELAAVGDPELAAKYEQIMDPQSGWAGLRRYWDTRERE